MGWPASIRSLKVGDLIDNEKFGVGKVVEVRGVLKEWESTTGEGRFEASEILVRFSDLSIKNQS